MRQPIPIELLRGELQLRHAFGNDSAAPRPLPGLANQRTHLLQPAIIEVACDELFMRTLDEKT